MTAVFLIRVVRIDPLKAPDWIHRLVRFHSDFVARALVPIPAFLSHPGFGSTNSPPPCYDDRAELFRAI
jgi:hypothetical protein